MSIDMTEKERTDTQLATLYDLRLQIKKSGKETYTTEELFELLDTVAQEKSKKEPFTYLLRCKVFLE